MKQKWVQAGGDYQFAFMGAAGQALHGNYATLCPRCKTTLRYYFHIFNIEEKTGTIWAWCSSCRMVDHLPRVQLQFGHWYDPFADYTSDEFILLERDENEHFLDRLDRLWDEKVISAPEL
jgi:hypothetical protein